MVALAFLLGLAITVRLARRSGLNAELVTNLTVYVALAGMLGAKLLMVVFGWNRYMANPRELFSWDTLQAAGVYQGGLILGLVTAYLYMRHQGLPLLSTADAFAPGIALGHGIGKIGCFAAGCCWGTPTSVPWAVKFHDPAAMALTGVPIEIALHPAQLYESGAELLVFGFLYWRFGRPHAPGQIIGMYLVVSSVLRFMIEFTRNHEQALPFGLPLSITQWIAIVLAAAGAVLLARARRPAPINQPLHA